MHTESTAPQTTKSTTDWIRQLAIRLHLPTTMIKFLIVGGIGFVINQFFLFLLYDTTIFGFLPEKGASETLFFFTHTDTRLLLSSIIAVEIAIIAQFNLNDRWTFRHRVRDGNIFLRFLKFNASSIVSPIIIVVTVNLLTPVLREGPNDTSAIGVLAPYIATTVGVLLGFIWNWTFTSVVIWPSRRRSQASDPS
jgi:putative flippase GtrA